MKDLNALNFLRVGAFAGCTALAMLAMPSTARAEFYAGASVGKAAVEADIDGNGFDEDDTSGKLIFGYVFDLPVIDISLETSYVDFGAPRDTSTGAEVEISGLDAFAVAGLDFGFIGVFAKAGVLAWDADTRLGDVTASSDGSDTAYGIGARFNVGSLFIRTEWERFDIEDADVDMLSAGVIWRF
jgi:hypothetical protein